MKCIVVPAHAGHAAIPHASRTAIAPLLLALMLVAPELALAQDTSSGPESGRAFMELYDPRPFAFNTLTVTAKRGLSGDASLYGIGADGARALLFHTTLGYADSLAPVFYAAPEFVMLEFIGQDGDGAALVSTVRLPPSSFGPGAIAVMRLNAAILTSQDDEAATLAALDFPFRAPSLLSQPASLTLAGAAPDAVAREAVARLFVPARRIVPLIMLAAWSVLAIIAGTRVKVRSLWLAVAIAMAASVAASMLGSAPAELYSVDVANGNGADTRNVARSVSRIVARSVTPAGAYRSVSWDSASREAGLRFVALRSPLAAAVPVSAFAGYTRLRFKSAPTVVEGDGGIPMLAAAPFSMVWGIHE